MEVRAKFIIDELLNEKFIDLSNEDKVIELEELEESGRSKLEFKTISDKTITIKNIDKKHTDMLFFRNDAALSMYKRVDHVIMDNIGGNKWNVYLIEMKSSLSDKTWIEVRGKFRASYLFIKAFAAILDIEINEVYMCTTYKNFKFTSNTIPSSKRIRTGTRNVPFIEEFQGGKFAIKLGDYLDFEHIPILMENNEEENRLIGIFDVNSILKNHNGT